MDFLYNPDNGMAFPWTQIIEDNRKDLVKVSIEELRAISKGANIADVIACRTKEPPTVEIVVPKEQEPVVEVVTDAQEAETMKEAESAVESVPTNGKGVVVKSKNPSVAKDNVDVFGNEIVDYTKYSKFYAIFPMEKFADVPDEDLVRFAKEALGRDQYREASDKLNEEERTRYYAMLRTSIAKNLAKDIKKKERRIANRGESMERNDE